MPYLGIYALQKCVSVLTTPNACTNTCIQIRISTWYVRMCVCVCACVYTHGTKPRIKLQNRIHASHWDLQQTSSYSKGSSFLELHSKDAPMVSYWPPTYIHEQSPFAFPSFLCKIDFSSTWWQLNWVLIQLFTKMHGCRWAEVPSFIQRSPAINIFQ
jgi:hypothetical protein